MTARRIDIAYGRGTIPVHVPEANLTKILRVRPWAGTPDPTSAVEAALANPIGTPPLAEIARGKKDAVIVISDKTRPVPNPVILPPVLNTLESAGIPREQILILIATGMHRPNEGSELVALVGEEIARHYRIENHRGTDLDSHVDLGVSEEGVPVLVDRRYVEADLKIVTGLIEPHLMAGYSGGRKGVLPGVSSLETMKVMHGYRMIQHPLTTVGRLDDNPFHQIALKIARRIGVDFLLNVTLNGDRELTGVYAGDLNDAHRAGVSELEEYVVDEVDEPVDIVVAGGGGYPLDQTLYQCIKGMIAAKGILKQGGTIVFCSHLGEGVGSPSFCSMLDELDSPQEFLDELMEEDYRQVDQWMVQDLCNVLLQTDEILFYTENLTDDRVRNALMEPIPSLDAGLERALAKHGAGARVAVIPQGPYLIAEVAEALGA